MSFDSLQQAQKQDWNCAGCGYSLGHTLKNFDEAAQINKLVDGLKGHCPRCGRELSRSPIPVDFPRIYFRFKAIAWRLRHAV